MEILVSEKKILTTGVNLLERSQERMEQPAKSDRSGGNWRHRMVPVPLSRIGSSSGALRIVDWFHLARTGCRGQGEKSGKTWLPAQRIWVLVAILQSLILPAISSGDSEWFIPQTSHFKNIDSQGRVSLIEPLCEINLTETLKVPIHACFSSFSNRPSPYLGHGWSIPLLEANIIQVSEDLFLLTEPGGQRCFLWRQKDKPTVITGQGSWRAEIRGETIEMVNPSGQRLTFRKGKITEIGWKGRRLNYIWEGDRVKELREGGRVIFAIGVDSETRLPARIESGGLTLATWTLQARPIIQSIGGQRVVSMLGESLGTFNDDNRVIYGVDAERRPTIAINSHAIYSWEPETGVIHSAGEWIYEIESGATKFEASTISRRSKDGQREKWFKSIEKGLEIVEYGNGDRTDTTWFTSGKLAGKSRTEKNTSSNGMTDEKRSYDEFGRLLRRSLNGVATDYDYGEGKYSEKIGGQIRVLEERHDQKIVKEYAIGDSRIVSTFDARGTLESIKSTHKINGKPTAQTNNQDK